MMRFEQEKNKISACSDGGPCSQVCARFTLRLAPIDTSANVLGGRAKFVETFSYQITGNSMHFLVFLKNNYFLPRV